MNKKQIKFVTKLRKQGVAWTDVAVEYHEQFEELLLADTLRHRYSRAIKDARPAQKEQKSTKPKAVDHLMIPDGQLKPGVPTKHWDALANYILEHRPKKIINIGDFWDMPSLSSYEGKGSRSAEGKRIKKDVDAGNAVMDSLMNKIHSKGGYKPELHFCLGNHEQRIERAVNSDPRLEEIVGYHMLSLDGWNVHDFLKPVALDGVAYAHYFYNPMSGRPIGGTIDTMLKKIGHTFSQGHRQEILYGRRDLNNGTHQHGLVAGAFYMHDEGYKGPQANDHWRGIIHKHDVKDGTYDIELVSLERLLRRYK